MSNNIPSGTANKFNELKEYDFVDTLNVFQSSRDMFTPQKYFTFNYNSNGFSILNIKTSARQD